MNGTVQKMNRLAQGNTSNWTSKAQWRKENEHWLNRSAKIAMKILLRLRECEMTQKDLAKQMGVSAQYVSKLLKGNENMSLETIAKIESLLNIQILEVIEDCCTKVVNESSDIYADMDI